MAFWCSFGINSHFLNQYLKSIKNNERWIPSTILKNHINVSLQRFWRSHWNEALNWYPHLQQTTFVYYLKTLPWVSLTVLYESESTMGIVWLVKPDRFNIGTLWLISIVVIFFITKFAIAAIAAFHTHKRLLEMRSKTNLKSHISNLIS